MNKIGLILWREFITRVRKPSFLIMTILGPLLIGGGITAVMVLGLQEAGDQEVLVIDRPQLLTGKLKDGGHVRFHYDRFDWPDSVFKASHFTLMIDVNEDVLNTSRVILYYKQHPSQNVQNIISAELERVLQLARMQDRKIDPELFGYVKKPVDITLTDIDKQGRRSFDQVKAYIGVGFAVLIYMFIFLYGVQVMRGVMEEKQNRIVEVLISSVKPFQLMMGKITGIALVGLTQFILWVGLTAVMIAVAAAVIGQGQYDPETIAAMRAGGTLQPDMQAAGPFFRNDREAEQFAAELLDSLPRILGLFLFYFVCGYLLYSSLFAAVGAAVDNETDTQQFMLPITLPMIIALLISELAVVNPDGPAVIWCSLIPFTSPVVMMIRVVTGNAFDHPGQLALSMVLLAGTFMLTTWLAGRIYRTGILMYGKKVSYRELAKWLFYKG